MAMKYFLLVLVSANSRIDTDYIPMGFLSRQQAFSEIFDQIHERWQTFHKSQNREKGILKSRLDFSWSYWYFSHIICVIA